MRLYATSEAHERLVQEAEKLWPELAKSQLDVGQLRDVSWLICAVQFTIMTQDTLRTHTYT
jgi:hypothetical protein